MRDEQQGQDPTIKIFAIGDVVGRPGRKIVRHFLDKIRTQYKPDILLANGENAAGGFGLTEKIYHEFIHDYGIDVITMGNHWHDKKEILKFHVGAEQLLLPANMNNVSDEARGLRIFQTQAGDRYAVLNFIGRAFMHDNNRNPFEAAARLMEKIPHDIKIRIIDMHAEATSEKQAMGYFLRGKASLVYGTHSHVPTADERIIEQHTGFITDLGASGSYDSIIGMDYKLVMKRMLTGQKTSLEPGKRNPWLCAIAADVDRHTGACVKIERIIWKLNDMDLS